MALNAKQVAGLVGGGSTLARRVVTASARNVRIQFVPGAGVLAFAAGGKPTGPKRKKAKKSGKKKVAAKRRASAGKKSATRKKSARARATVKNAAAIAAGASDKVRAGRRRTKRATVRTGGAARQRSRGAVARRVLAKRVKAAEKAAASVPPEVHAVATAAVEAMKATPVARGKRGRSKVQRELFS